MRTFLGFIGFAILFAAAAIGLHLQGPAGGSGIRGIVLAVIGAIMFRGVWWFAHRGDKSKSN
jgi:uncharacterized membrane protein